MVFYIIVIYFYYDFNLDSNLTEYVFVFVFFLLKCVSSYELEMKIKRNEKYFYTSRLPEFNEITINYKESNKTSYVDVAFDSVYYGLKTIIICHIVLIVM